MNARDARQADLFKWVRRTFGDQAALPFDRALRVVEEAIELAQAEGVPREQAIAIVEHVFKKPKGKPIQEAGGLGLCLLGYCASKNFSADSAERLEYDRVTSMSPEYFRERHNKKADAGIAVRVPTDLPKEKLSTEPELPKTWGDPIEEHLPQIAKDRPTVYAAWKYTREQLRGLNETAVAVHDILEEFEDRMSAVEATLGKLTAQEK